MALATFPSPQAFRAWLAQHHKTASELVVRCSKAQAKDRGLTYAEALDEALCFGWIDGVRRSVDAESFSVRFGRLLECSAKRERIPLLRRGEA